VDPDAEREFAEYFRARRDAVRRTAFLLCGDWHRADDHAQSTFVALHRNRRRIKDKGALDAWVRRTLVRAVVDESSSRPGTRWSERCGPSRRGSGRSWCCGSSRGSTSPGPPPRSAARRAR
jgi:hypothetical protein